MAIFFYLYHDGVLYLRDEGRDLVVDDVVVGRPAAERGREVVLADVDEVERVPEAVGVDRGAPTCMPGPQGGQSSLVTCVACLRTNMEAAGRHGVCVP